MALASAVCDSAIGVRNSSNRISPGCGLGSRLVVVNDFDFVRIVPSPDKAANNVMRCNHSVGGLRAERHDCASTQMPPSPASRSRMCGSCCGGLTMDIGAAA